MPDPIRLMHFADTHFGVETYGRLDPTTGLITRLQDFRESLCRCIDDALGKGVQLALFAGDAYKSRDPSQTQQREFALCIRKLTQAGIPVVMLTGNHDIPGVKGRAHAMEIYGTLGVDNVTILHQPSVVVIETSGGPVQIAAMPYMMRGFLLAREEYVGKTTEHIRTSMEQRYHEYLEDLAGKVDRSLPTVLMGHFWVRGAQLSQWQQTYFNPNEPQVAISDLARPEVWDYVALGHIHKQQDLNDKSQPPVVYCGSPDRIDFGERREPKGYVYVELAKGAATFKHIAASGCREMHDIVVEADNENPTESILAELATYDLKDNIVRLTYTISADNLALLRDREIREALQPAFLVAGIRADVRRDQAARARILSESLDPMAALTRYLEQSKGEKRRDELIPFAERLMEELRREEAVA